MRNRKRHAASTKETHYFKYKNVLWWPFSLQVRSACIASTPFGICTCTRCIQDELRPFWWFLPANTSTKTVSLHILTIRRGVGNAPTQFTPTQIRKKAGVTFLCRNYTNAILPHINTKKAEVTFLWKTGLVCPP